jgi:hypothetical protein
MLRFLLALFALHACTACKARDVSKADAWQDAMSLRSPGESADGTATRWWLWAAGELRSPGDVGADAALGETWIGPSVAQIQPSGDPVDVRAFQIPERINREQVQDGCRTLWLVRRLLPPARDEGKFLDRLHRLDSTLAHVNKGPVVFERAVDLGFGIHRESAHLTADVATWELDVASYDGKLFGVKVTASAPPEIAPIISAALSEGFSPVRGVVPRPGGRFFWQVEYQLPDTAAGARRALDDALGAGPEVTVPPELSGAYSRLTSPVDHLLAVWKGSEGRGYQE